MATNTQTTKDVAMDILTKESGLTQSQASAMLSLMGMVAVSQLKKEVEDE